MEGRSVAESRLPLHTIAETELEATLRDFATSIAFPRTVAPAGGPDIAARVRAPVASLPEPRRRSWPALGGFRPMRRGLVLALAALLILAAIAGAVGLGLPGIRIFFGEGTPSPGATPGASSASPTTRGSTTPGALLGLGAAVTLEDAERIAGFDVILPPNPDLGPPDVVYISGRRLALVWAPSPGFPDIGSEGVGLLINEFRGHVSDGYYQKVLSDDARVEPVTVGGSPGYWIKGAHFFTYIDETGKDVDDSHRVVGDTLIWTTGEMTYRIETSLGKDAAIALAESLR
jgi:hypothetical protein